MSETNEIIEGEIASLRRDIELLKEEEEEEKDNYKKIQIMKGLAHVQDILILFHIVKEQEHYLEDLRDSISKLPDMTEFETIKKTVSRYNDRAKSLESIKQIYDEYKEREKRGQTIYE